MKFNVPKIVKVLNAGEYAAELEAVKICVWVNPPKSLLNRHDEAIERFMVAWRERIAEPIRTPPPAPPRQQGGEEEGKSLAAEVDAVRAEMCGVFADLWSAGPDVETRWSAAEIDALISGMAETDPQLWPWLRLRTLAMIREHREIVKKV